LVNGVCTVNAQSNRSSALNITATNIWISPIHKGYIVSDDGKKVYVINLNTNKILDYIDIPHPNATFGNIAINNKTGLIYVGFEDGFYVIDGNKDDIVDEIKASGVSGDFKVDSTKNKMYLLGSGEDAGDLLSELNLKTKQKERSIPLEDGSYSIELDPIKDLVYVVNSYHDYVSVIDASNSSKGLRILENVTVASSPYRIAFNPISHEVYTINQKINRISAIDADNNNTVRNIILNSSSIEEEAPSIAVDPKTGLVFVSKPKESKILVVDGKPGKVVATLDSGVYPTNLKLDTSDDLLYITSLSDPIKILNVTKDSIDKSSAKTVFDLKHGIVFDDVPIGMAINPIANKIYVIYDSQNKISVMDGESNRITRTIDLDFVPSELSINPKTNVLFAISNNTLYSIDANNNRIVHKSAINGSSLDGLAIDVNSNRIYLHDRDYLNDASSSLPQKKLKVMERVIDGHTYREINSFKSDKHLIADPLIYTLHKRDNVFLVSDQDHTNVSIPEQQSIKALDYNPITNLAYALGDKFLYVVDFDANSVNKIKMGSAFTSDVVLNPNSNLIYVSDSLRNVVEVINGTDNKVIKEIPVDMSPSQMKVNSETNTVYVINKNSESISVIDGSLGSVLVPGITFNIYPPNAGYVKCGTEDIATNKYARLPYGAKCAAHTNKGFEFVNWNENLDKNSTRVVSTHAKDDNWYAQFTNWIKSLENNIGVETSDNSATAFVVQKSGNFTSNFNELPPPLPPEYWATLSGFVLTTIVGAYFIPSFIGWSRSKSDSRKLNHYHKKIMSTYDDGNLDENDIGSLDALKTEITNDYSKGKLNEKHYGILMDQISISFEEVFTKRLGSLEQSDENIKTRLRGLERDISEAYSKGKINELHYKLLKEKISNIEDKDEIKH